MKKILLAICMCLTLVICCACSEEENRVVLLEDSVIMNSINAGNEDFTVCFNYLYQGNRPNFELVDVEETGLGSYSYTCEDLTTEEYNKEYRGYRMGTVCVEFFLEK